MGTYKDFLEMLGISHPAFIIILIVLFLVLSFVVLLWKMGLLTTISFKQVSLPQSNIIYTKYKGNYDTINNQVQSVLKDTTPYFKFSDLFGIYYDPI